MPQSLHKGPHGMSPSQDDKLSGTAVLQRLREEPQAESPRLLNKKSLHAREEGAG